MLDSVRLLDLIEAGNASLLLVKGAHPAGELPKVYVHITRTAYCPDTGAPTEKRDVLDLEDLARAAQKAEQNLERATVELPFRTLFPESTVVFGESPSATPELAIDHHARGGPLCAPWPVWEQPARQGAVAGHTVPPAQRPLPDNACRCLPIPCMMRLVLPPCAPYPLSHSGER